MLNALTVRRVTGVDRLRARFPEADGRAVKVAVFDTGIDFGVEGVSAGGKLEGFYDLTGFGVVETRPIESGTALPLALPAELGAVVPLTVEGTDTGRAFARSSLFGGSASAGITASSAAVPAIAASLPLPMPP